MLRLGDGTGVRSFGCPVSVAQGHETNTLFYLQTSLEQHIRESKGGEAIVDMILQRAEKHVQKELLCDGNHNVLLGKRKSIENFTGFALKVQNKNCTEMEQLIENKLSREEMLTIYPCRREEWCREASMTKQKGMEAVENKKAFFKELQKMGKVINSSTSNRAGKGGF